jgi:hypothetical protein
VGVEVKNRMDWLIHSTALVESSSCNTGTTTTVALDSTSTSTWANDRVIFLWGVQYYACNKARSSGFQDILVRGLR